jgi:NADH dehydrogenase
VFVIGDCASSTLPASAQLAEQHGVSAGKTIRAFLNGKPAPKLGAPKNLGMFGSLGKYNGFGRAFGVTVTGFIPRMMKHVINIYYRFTVK